MPKNRLQKRLWDSKIAGSRRERRPKNKFQISQISSDVLATQLSSFNKIRAAAIELFDFMSMIICLFGNFCNQKCFSSEKQFKISQHGLSNYYSILGNSMN